MFSWVKASARHNVATKPCRFAEILPVAFVIFVASFLAVDGQEEKLTLNPPLSHVFPLDLTPAGVRLKFPVLLNEHTVLRPDAVLRFIYIDPNAGAHPRGGGNGGGPGGAGMGGGHGHHHGSSSPDGGDGGSASPRSSSSSDGDNSSPPSGLGANKDSTSEIRTEVWTETDLFREALDEAADIGTTVVYSLPGKPKPQSATIDLPDGMLLAEVGGHVQVLGLTEESRAFQSGLRPGDEIRSFEGHLPVALLADFQRVYPTVKAAAQKSDKAYAVEGLARGRSSAGDHSSGGPAFPSFTFLSHCVSSPSLGDRRLPKDYAQDFSWI